MQDIRTNSIQHGRIVFGLQSKLCRMDVPFKRRKTKKFKQMSAYSNSFLWDVKRDALVKVPHAMHREPELFNGEWKTQQRIRGLLERFVLLVSMSTLKAPRPRQRTDCGGGDIDTVSAQETREDLC